LEIGQNQRYMSYDCSPSCSYWDQRRKLHDNVLKVSFCTISTFKEDDLPTRLAQVVYSCYSATYFFNLTNMVNTRIWHISHNKFYGYKISTRKFFFSLKPTVPLCEDSSSNSSWRGRRTCRQTIFLFSSLRFFFPFCHA